MIAPDADEDSSDELFFQVTYSDGDVEDYTFTELRPLLQAHSKQPILASASIAYDEYDDDSYEKDEIPSSEALSMHSVIDTYQSLMLHASANV